MTMILEPEARLTPERRRLGQNRARQTVDQLTAPRERQREARQYAEQWYQALLCWQVEHSRVPTPAVTYSGFADRWGYVTTLGEVLPDQATMLRLPTGQYLEGEVAQIITRMGLSTAKETRESGRLLDALRRPEARKPESLLRAGASWARDASRMAAWGLAVLSLAVVLRDEQAEAHLVYCRQVMGHPDKMEGDE